MPSGWAIAMPKGSNAPSILMLQNYIAPLPATIIHFQSRQALWKDELWLATLIGARLKPKKQLRHGVT